MKEKEKEQKTKRNKKNPSPHDIIQPLGMHRSDIVIELGYVPADRRLGHQVRKRARRTAACIPVQLVVRTFVHTNRQTCSKADVHAGSHENRQEVRDRQAIMKRDRQSLSQHSVVESQYSVVDIRESAESSISIFRSFIQFDFSLMVRSHERKKNGGQGVGERP